MTTERREQEPAGVNRAEPVERVRPPREHLTRLDPETVPRTPA